jgi:outer membrane protein assembly factor BamB
MIAPRVVAVPPADVAPRGIACAASLESLRAALAALRPWFDAPELFAGLERAGVLALLRDLAWSLAQLVAAERSRAVVAGETRANGWELGLERSGDDLLVTVYRPGAQPEVAQTDRALPIAQAGRALLRAIRACAGPPSARDACSGEPAVMTPVAVGLGVAREQLERALSAPTSAPAPSLERLTAESTARCRLSLRAELALRGRVPSRRGAAKLRRADLHALLFLGELRAAVGESACTLRAVHPFLLTEQLLWMASAVLEARDAGRSLVSRRQAGRASCGVQLDPAGQVSVLLSDGSGERGSRLPPVSADDFVRAVRTFGRAMLQAVVRADRAQRSNLRVASLRTMLRNLTTLARRRVPAGASRHAERAPDSYRAFADGEVEGLRDRGTPPLAPAPASGRLRFTESWRAAVGGLDLRAVFHCGDGIVVGSSREIACLERRSGELLWRAPSPRAISILTPVGVVRLAPDGGLRLHRFEDGEVELELSIGPCLGASTSGAVVHAPGLPHMLLVAEGPHHLVAIDLDAGEVRWRRALRRCGAVRVRRAGRLVVVTSGSSEIVGLDVLTGEVVWRHVGRLRHVRGTIIDGSELYVFGSDRPERAGGPLVERIDPFSGEVVWTSRLPRPMGVQGAPRCGSDTVLLVSEDPAGRRGLVALDRTSGSLRYDLDGVLGQGEVACVVLDDTLIANSEAGQLLGIGVTDGVVRYRQVFARWHGQTHELDRPQSLEPVLRCGALFVPQSELHVLRPSDGALLGQVPSDLVPDVVRVDERCGVYVGEQSGHLAAYTALPTLRLVPTPSAPAP